MWASRVLRSNRAGAFFFTLHQGTSTVGAFICWFVFLFFPFLRHLNNNSLTMQFCMDFIGYKIPDKAERVFSCHTTTSFKPIFQMSCSPPFFFDNAREGFLLTLQRYVYTGKPLTVWFEPPLSLDLNPKKNDLFLKIFANSGNIHGKRAGFNQMTNNTGPEIDALILEGTVWNSPILNLCIFFVARITS